MGRVTICPQFLFIKGGMLPERIEIEYINPLSQLLAAISENKIDLILEGEILTLARDQFPWNKMSDDHWKGYLLDWNILINSRISRIGVIINSANITKFDTIKCRMLAPNIQRLFSRLLSNFGSKKLPNGSYEEGIYVHSTCDNKPNFFNFNNTAELTKIEFPWLQIYNVNLPTSGEFSFTPPANWRRRKTPLCGKQYGFIDRNHNEWTWDKSHNNHWDVQQANKKTHLNVSTDGRILR